MATVSYPKIWNSGEVLTAADLNAEFAAVGGISGIAGSQLLPQTIDTAQLKDVSVTAAKLADGATKAQFISITGAPTTIGTGDTICVSQAITQLRSNIRVSAMAFGSASLTADGGETLIMKIKRDTVTIYTLPGVSFTRPAGAIVTYPISLSFEGVISGTVPAAHTYTVELIKSFGGTGTFSVACMLNLEEIA